MQEQPVSAVNTLHKTYRPINCPSCGKTINRVKFIDGLLKCKCGKYYHAVMDNSGKLTMEESVLSN